MEDTFHRLPGPPHPNLSRFSSSCFVVESRHTRAEGLIYSQATWNPGPRGREGCDILKNLPESTPEFGVLILEAGRLAGKNGVREAKTVPVEMSVLQSSMKAVNSGPAPNVG